jgi:ribosome-associated heat shock protein Hsp15
MKKPNDAPDTAEGSRIRIDKWLWAARFYKTRGLACDEIDKGRISIQGLTVKASREVRVGDLIELRQGPLLRTVVVRALSVQRGPAAVAQGMYDETPESVARRAQQAEQRRQGTEPSQSIEQGRPTKRDRRKLADWNRWSASADPE